MAAAAGDLYRLPDGRDPAFRTASVCGRIHQGIASQSRQPDPAKSQARRCGPDNIALTRFVGNDPPGRGREPHEHLLRATSAGTATERGKSIRSRPMGILSDLDKKLTDNLYEH